MTSKLLSTRPCVTDMGAVIGRRVRDGLKMTTVKLHLRIRLRLSYPQVPERYRLFIFADRYVSQALIISKTVRSNNYFLTRVSVCILHLRFVLDLVDHFVLDLRSVDDFDFAAASRRTNILTPRRQ